jgi:hypothetical protein
VQMELLEDVAVVVALGQQLEDLHLALGERGVGTACSSARIDAVSRLWTRAYPPPVVAASRFLPGRSAARIRQAGSDSVHE